MNNSCKECKFYNDGKGSVTCEFCDAEFNDCFESKERSESDNEERK